MTETTKPKRGVKKSQHTGMNLVGQVFGKLTVLHRWQPSPEEAPSWSRRSRPWVCTCTCGRETRVTTGNLRAGTTKSCGCGKTDAYRTHTPEWEAECLRLWANGEKSYKNVALMLGVGKAVVARAIQRLRTDGKKGVGSGRKLPKKAARPPNKPMPILVAHVADQDENAAVEAPVADWQGIPFLETGLFHCRAPLWPLSDKTGHVCGRPVLEKNGEIYSWCKEHSKRFFLKPAPSRGNGMNVTIMSKRQTNGAR